LKSKLFGSSGVRGLVNVDLTPVLVAKIGLAISTFSRAEKILVGRDTRVSGLMVENALVSGLLAGGVRVDCLGVVPTPVLAYLTGESGADAGVMITASHNPPQYNGIKIFSGEGVAYTEESQNEIERHGLSDEHRLALANAVAAYYISNPKGTHPTRKKLVQFIERLSKELT